MNTTAPSLANPVLKEWNSFDDDAACAAILPCCGSQAWAIALVSRRPFAWESELLEASRSIWYALPEADWQQAFDSHPRIGETKPQGSASQASLALSKAEQHAAMLSEEPRKAALQQANARYEQRFGRIFIICARGRSAPEIIAELERRLGNGPAAELLEAAQQQAQITELRLKQWLESH